MSEPTKRYRMTTHIADGDRRAFGKVVDLDRPPARVLVMDKWGDVLEAFAIRSPTGERTFPDHSIGRTPEPAMPCDKPCDRKPCCKDDGEDTVKDLQAMLVLIGERAKALGLNYDFRMDRNGVYIFQVAEQASDDES